MSADMGNTSVISPVDNNNGSGTMPSFLGSAAPSTLDDAGRAFMGAAAREWENRSYPTATGTAPAFVVTYTVAPAAYRSGQTYTFTAHAAAVGTDTLNANTLGAKGIKKVVAGVKTATAANDFYTGDKIACVYDGTDMVWSNWGAGFAASTTTQQLSGTIVGVASTPDSVAALWEAGADIADGAAITIGEGGYFNLITSTTAITSFSITTDKAGRSFRVRFDTARTLTHNGTSLILPGAANITTIAGDIAFVRSLGSGNVIVEQYVRGALAPQTSGTFTPTLELGGAAVGMTFNYRAGNYTKIGNKVTIWVDILLTAEGSSTGYATITGLPFTQSASNGAVAPVWTTGMSSLVDGVTAQLTAGSATVGLWIGSATGNTQLTNTHTGNTSRFMFTMTYFT